ncbi:hypothetical protein HK57_00217 [Aspergillus ustus]|uniref:O-methyltransferase domain-containing protein n=1 Tax=Aspergillus ustus TaxID=40382 RepID=A0A0C1E591_ASPUT|nr:hypothetical protein HK57_00217 [Aspergillus ustus]
MDELTELEVQGDKLAAAIKSHAQHRRDLQLSASDISGNHPDTTKSLSKTIADIHASMARIRTLLGGPVSFLQELARQVQTVACLKWLSEFQILACIPPDGNMTMTDLADLAGVPEPQLARIIRLMSTSGFLNEPLPNHVSHTPISAEFISNQPLLDATAFLTHIVAPTALQMAPATHRFGSSQTASHTAYNLAMDTAQPFGVAIHERPKWGRQWAAYLHRAGGLRQESEIVNMLAQLKWANIGNALIVEVNAQSTAIAQSLAKRFPTLRVVVQMDRARASSLNLNLMEFDYPRQAPYEVNMNMRMNTRHGFAGDFDIDTYTHGQLGPLNTESTLTSTLSSVSTPAFSSQPGSSSFFVSANANTSGNITVTYRTNGMTQPVLGAAVYILHLANYNPNSETTTTTSTLHAELHNYLGVLRGSGGILLIPTENLLPEPGSVTDPGLEAVARARDLAMLQLGNEGEMEIMELVGVIGSIRDGAGKLVVTNQLKAGNSLVVGLMVRYEGYY